MRLVPLFMFLALANTAGAQSILPSPDNRLVVLGEATVELPADRVILTVDLTARDSANVQQAYKKHKQLEANLVKFLKEAALPDTAVHYQLFTIRQEPGYDGRRQVPGDYVTNQSVTMTLTNVKQYAEFLVKLMGAGFTDVSAQFKSSKETAFQSTLLAEAVKAARRKADVMAQTASRRISRVSKIMDTEETDPVFQRIIPMASPSAGAFKRAASNDAALTDIPQTIRLATQVKVVFELDPRFP